MKATKQHEWKETGYNGPRREPMRNNPQPTERRMRLGGVTLTPEARQALERDAKGYGCTPREMAQHLLEQVLVHDARERAE